MHKVFISYHHEEDQYYKDLLIDMNKWHGLFIDGSVDTGDIGETRDAQKIRRKIRDDFLRDTSVTILLCGRKTRYRKHIDWELASSMIDGQKNKKSGILVFMLPSICVGSRGHAPHDYEKQVIYPDVIRWESFGSEAAYKERYPELPERIIDNLVNLDAKISVCSWHRVWNRPDRLKWLIDVAYQSRRTNEYDLSEPRRKHDRNPAA